MYVNATDYLLELDIHKVDDLTESVKDTISFLANHLLNCLDFKIDIPPYDQKPNLSFDLDSTNSENYQKLKYILNNIDDVLDDVKKGNPIEIYTIDKFNYSLDVSFNKETSKFEIKVTSNLPGKPWRVTIKWID